MDLEELIIAVFCLVDDLLPSVTEGKRLRQRGPMPTLTDSEVITIEAVGAFLGYTQDRALVRSFRQHWAHFFPGLTRIHRTTFVRQAANLWAVTEQLWQLLGDLIPRDPHLAIVDSCPLSVCRWGRAHRHRSFWYGTGYGKDYLSKESFYGFRLHLRIEWPGIIRQLQLAPANWSELRVVPALLADYQGYVLGDSGYWSPRLREETTSQGVHLLTPFKHKTSDLWPEFTYWLSRKRYRIETVLGQLTDRFRIKEVWARDWWHLCNRLLRVVLMHTMAIYLNREAAQPPLQFERLGS